MTESIVIEEIRDLDRVWPELSDLFLELHKYHEPWVSRQLRSIWADRWREFVELRPDRLLLLARSEGSAIAYLNAQVRRDFGIFDEVVGFIDDAFVKEGYRSMGIGSELLQICEEWCRARGATELRLNVIEGNRLGYEFWTKSGFTPASHLMSKTLQGKQI